MGFNKHKTDISVELNVSSFISQELSSVSFEELLKLRNKVGIKAYQRMAIEKTAENTTKPKKRQSSDKHR